MHLTQDLLVSERAVSVPGPPEPPGSSLRRALQRARRPHSTTGRARHGDPDVDVLAVGAGVSGVGIACHLALAHPERSVTILERPAPARALRRGAGAPEPERLSRGLGFCRSVWARPGTAAPARGDQRSPT